MGELKTVRYGEMVRNAGNPSGAHREVTAIAEAYRACAAAVVKRATATLEVAAEGSYSDRLRLIFAESLALSTEFR